MGEKSDKAFEALLRLAGAPESQELPLVFLEALRAVVRAEIADAMRLDEAQVRAHEALQDEEQRKLRAGMDAAYEADAMRAKEPGLGLGFEHHCAPAKVAQELNRWRVGRKLGRTLYNGETLCGLLDSADVAQRIADALNRAETPAVSGAPAKAEGEEKLCECCRRKVGSVKEAVDAAHRAGRVEAYRDAAVHVLCGEIRNIHTDFLERALRIEKGGE